MVFWSVEILRSQVTLQLRLDYVKLIISRYDSVVYIFAP